MRDVTDNPGMRGERPRDPMRDPAATPSNPSADRATGPASDPAHTPAAARSADVESGDKSGDIPAMLDRALQPVLTEFGHMRTQLGDVSERLDDIEQAQQPAAPPAAEPPTPVKSKRNGNGLVIGLATAVLTVLATLQVGGFTALSNQIRDVNDRVDATRAELIARSDATNARIDSTNQRVTQLGTDLRAEMAALVERIHAIEVRLAELFARLDSLARGQTHTDQRLARLEGAFDLPPLPQPPLTDIDSNIDGS